MFPYLPHTEEDIRQMLKSVGAESLDDLFADIPESVRLKKALNLPPGAGEFEVYRRMEKLARKNRVEPISFLGCGIYDHLIPAAVGHLTSRAEFATAYTPYQAEMSQGMLQGIFEFQSMICRLTGLDVSNASLYDGHTAAAEAAAMALNSVKKGDTILVSSTVHPATIEVMETYYADLGVKISLLGQKEGTTSREELADRLDGSVAGVLIQTPNVYGILEDLTGLDEQINANGSILIISANPLSLGVCRSPREWGADIAVGDCQPLGLPQNFGGPTAGYIAAGEKLIRKMPGRISGLTQDGDGNRGFVLTLQAREQHIKRQRATSNICSNQALAALASTVHLSLLGKEGFRETSLRNMNNARYAFEKLTAVSGVEAAFPGSFFNEFTLNLKNDAEDTADRLIEAGFFAGVPEKRLHSRGDSNRIIVAVTEKRTREEIDGLAAALKEALA